MTYKKILLSGLLLTLNNVVFCENFFKELFLEKLCEILNSIKSGAHLLQSAGPAGSNTGNNAAGVATKQNNNGTASVSSQSGAAGAAAPAPVKFNKYFLNKFIKEELGLLKRDIKCAGSMPNYYEPAAGCIEALKHKVALTYIQKNFDEDPNMFAQAIEKYIREQIKNIKDSKNNPHFNEIEDSIPWHDETGLSDYKRLHDDAIRNLEKHYKNIFDKNI